MELSYITLANVVDIERRNIFLGEIHICGGKIKDIVNTGPEDPSLGYAMPGFVDSHLHIESSMMTPDAFAVKAIIHGTVAVLPDPHEIANVLGVEGVEYMIELSKASPLHFFFGVPSCVPSTDKETSGAVLYAADVEKLMRLPEINHLSEVMNVPAVLSGEKDMTGKLAAAKKRGYVIDGHSPQLSGESLKKYVDAGIGNDHECSTLDEAREKLMLGMKIEIREGSAAKNFEVLSPLLDEYPDDVMLCTDDCSPEYIDGGLIDRLVRRAVEKGHSLWNVLKAACINPVIYYKLDTGLLRKGDNADFILVDNLKDFNVTGTVLDGIMYDSEYNVPKGLAAECKKVVNNFKAGPVVAADFAVHAECCGNLRVIEAFDGSLFTNQSESEPLLCGDNVVSDIEHDVLKVIVINRYTAAAVPAIGFIRGFGLKKGAIASSVMHDSHNIIAVGTPDEALAAAVNAIVENKGGLSVYDGIETTTLPLPIAGLMSPLSADEIKSMLNDVHNKASKIGTNFKDVFMTLSFMALPVIPELKMTDKGLFDVKTFSHISLCK